MSDTEAQKTHDQRLQQLSNAAAKYKGDRDSLLKGMIEAYRIMSVGHIHEGKKRLEALIKARTGGKV